MFERSLALLSTLAVSTATVGCSSGPCPSSPPEPSTNCAADADALCSWGDDPRFYCRPHAFCVASSWELYDAGCAPLAAGCPTTNPTPTLTDTAPCTYEELGLDCQYAGYAITCSGLCYDGADFLGYNLWCAATQSNSAACPVLVPNAGAPCDSEGLFCVYDNSCQGFLLGCSGGFWLWQETTCPFLTNWP
jgi:hypothetical protein